MPVVFCGKKYRKFIFSWRPLDQNEHCGLGYQLNIHLQDYCTICIQGVTKRDILHKVCKNFPELKIVAAQSYNKKFKNIVGEGITGAYSDSKGIEIIDDDMPF